MSVLHPLLSRGNGKVGEGVMCWSLPAVTTCPGRSELCERVCYARRGRFRLRTVQDRLAENLAAACEDNFAARMIGEIRRRCPRGIVRVHVSGDFFSVEYAEAWLEISLACKQTLFYAYTRSWRSEGIAECLEDLAALRNWRLWFSLDAETGVPPTDYIPRGVRLAFLQNEDGPIPDRTKVVFRTQILRSKKPKAIALKLVCPTERPDAPDVSCSECGRCWKED